MQVFRLMKKASIFLLAFFIFIPVNAYAQSYLTLIIDDIGDDFHNGKQAIELPGPLTYALLPYSPHAQKLAALGIKSNKEFILHSPMQSVDSRLHTEYTLHMHMTELQFKQQLQSQLSSFPFIKGINNHMGSLLTMHPGYMKILMQELKQYKSLYFIDSRTTAHSIALKVAQEHNIPSVKRDVFLDSETGIQFINHQLDQAIKLSRTKGYAVAIAHPYDNTLKVLKQRLPKLISSDIKLLNASTLIKKLWENNNEESTDTLSAGL